MRLKRLLIFAVLLFTGSVVGGALYFQTPKGFLIFLIAELVIGLLCAEIAFRLIYRIINGRAYSFIPPIPFKELYIEPHPYIPFVYKKHAIGQKGGEANYPLHKGRFQYVQTTTNNYRCIDGINGDRDVIVPKPEGLKRIICLGASTTGNNIKEADKVYSYPMELERNLQAESKENVEVINFGQGGYNSADILVKFNLKLIDSEPDMVVIYHAYNDIRNYLTLGFDSDYSHSRQNLGNTYWQYKFADKMPNIPLKVYNFLLNSLVSTNIRYSLLDEVAKGKIDVTQDPSEGLAAYRRNIQLIIDICKSRGIQVVLSTYCHFLYEEIENDDLHKLYSKIVAQENDIIRQLSIDNDVTLVDNAALVPQEKEYFVDSVHFTPKGMQSIAENIAGAILAMDK